MSRLLPISLLLLLPHTVFASIYNLATGEIIPGTEGITPAPGISLTDWNLPNHNLQYALFNVPDLSGADFSRSDLSNSLVYSTLNGVNFTDANLTGGAFYNNSFTNTIFTNATIANVSFSAPISDSQLYSTASYAGGNLSGIRFGITGSNLNLAGKNLSNAYLVAPNFTNANLANTNFTGAYFYGVTLTNANFSGAVINGAGFAWANGPTAAQVYSTASFAAHNLSQVDLSTTDLNGFDFSNQDLSGAVLSDTVANADFTNSIVKGASLPNLTPAQLYSTTSYAQKDLAGTFFSGNYAGFNFAGQNLSNASFASGSIANALFAGANIKGAHFSESLSAAQLHSTATWVANDLAGTTFEHATLTGWNLANKDLTNCSFRYSHFDNADLTDADITGANFSNTFGLTPAMLASTKNYKLHNLTNFNASTVNLSGFDFSNQDLSNASFYYSNITNANFANATISGVQFNYVNRNGTFTSSQLYSTASYLGHDLKNVRFQEAGMSGWNFAAQDLAGSGFSQCDLTNADFTNANLTNVQFYQAALGNTNFTNAVITGASFSGTALTPGQLYSTASYQAGNLDRVTFPTTTNWNFHGQSLIRASFGSKVFSADFAKADLRGAVNSYGTPIVNSDITDAILPDGTVQNLHIDAAERRAPHPYSLAIKVLGSLTIASPSPGIFSGTLDLSSNKLIIQPAHDNKAAALYDTQQQVSAGHTSGFGITSSALTPDTALAVIDNATLPIPLTRFGSQPVDTDSILLSLQLLGDANIDGSIDELDHDIITSHFNESGANWATGDFNNDRLTDQSDLDIFNAHATPVPEPAALLLLAPVTLIGLRRRAPRHLATPTSRPAPSAKSLE